MTARNAVDGENVAFMSDDEDVEGIAMPGQGPRSTPPAPRREPTTKGRIEGGFQIDKPQAGNVPTIDGNPANRYPKRVSLAYTFDGETLVRPEYLEVILPQVRPPAASGPDPGSALMVESKVEYTIVDSFDREIKAESVLDYLYLYGAGMKAWEALGEQPNRVIERGKVRDRRTLQPKPDKYNDHVYLTAAGVNNRGEARPPIGPLGTAQRSQTLVRDDRMKKATFKDTLVFTAPTDPDVRGAMWRAATGRNTLESLEQASAEANARDNALLGRPPSDQAFGGDREPLKGPR